MQKKQQVFSVIFFFLKTITLKSVRRVFLRRDGSTSLKEMFSLKVSNVCSKVCYTLEKVPLPEFNSI